MAPHCHEAARCPRQRPVAPMRGSAAPPVPLSAPGAFGLLSVLFGALLGACGPACGDASSHKRRAGRSAALSAARRAQQRGDYAKAMQTLRKALGAHPDDPQLLNRFALAARLRYDATGELDFRDQELVALRKANAALSRYLVPVRLRVAIWTNLGTTLWEMGMRREARIPYRKVLRWAPHHPDAAEILHRIRQAETAKGSSRNQYEAPRAPRRPAGKARGGRIHGRIQPTRNAASRSGSATECRSDSCSSP